jgi:hypothetical protein
MSTNKKKSSYLEREVSISSKNRTLALLADDSDDEFDVESFIKSVSKKKDIPKEMDSDDDNNEKDDNISTDDDNDYKEDLKDNQIQNKLKCLEKKQEKEENNFKEIKKQLDTYLEEKYLTLPASFILPSNQISTKTEIYKLPNILTDSSCPSMLANVFTTYNNLKICLKFNYLTKWCINKSSLIPDTIMTGLFLLSYSNKEFSNKATRNIKLLLLKKVRLN